MIQYKELFVGSVCNNDCLYCLKDDDSPSPDLSDVLAQITPDKYLDSLELFGGEPTLRPDFFKILEMARKSGFKRIKVVTNARAFADFRTASRTVEAGCYFFEIKVHHYHPAIHDSVTQVSGSLDQTLQGIENLRLIDAINDEPFQAFIQLRISISKHNYQDVGKVALALLDYDIDRITLSFDDPEIKLSGVIPHVKDAINASILNRVWVTTQNIPLCAMKDFEHHVSEIYFPSRRSFRKSDHCHQCLYDPICAGISATYFDRFGFLDLKPVTERRHLEHIRSLYNEQD